MTGLILITLFSQANWVYQYDGAGNGWDQAASLVSGADSDLYFCGWGYYGYPRYYDMLLVRLSRTGGQDWVYTYDRGVAAVDWANDLIYGADNNLYMAGVSYGDSSASDFAVVSVDTTGQARWVYVLDTIFAPGPDAAYSLVQGPSGALYIAGYCWGQYKDMVVVSLDTASAAKWVFWLNDTGNQDDEAFDIVYGPDDCLYLAGYTTVTDSMQDFAVVKLDTGRQWFQQRALALPVQRLGQSGRQSVFRRLRK